MKDDTKRKKGRYKLLEKTCQEYKQEIFDKLKNMNFENEFGFGLEKYNFKPKKLNDNYTLLQMSEGYPYREEWGFLKIAIEGYGDYAKINREAYIPTKGSLNRGFNSDKYEMEIYEKLKYFLEEEMFKIFYITEVEKI